MSDDTTELVIPELLPPATAPRRRVRDRAWVESLLADWLADKAATTLRAYQSDMSDFAQFVVGDPRAAGEALAELMAAGEEEGHLTIQRYRADMLRRPVWRSSRARDAGEKPTKTGLAPRTINRRLAALRSIIRLARLGWKLDIRGIKVAAVKDTKGITRQEFLTMLRSLEARAAEALEAEKAGAFLQAIRDTCILRLWHDMGLRRQSVQLLDLEHVDLRRKMLTVYLKGHGDETRDKPIPGPTRKVIKAYLEARGRQPGPLFFSLSHRSYGARINDTSYNKILTRIVEQAGLVQANPHKFRHTAITRALDKGASVRDVQAFSDHADVRTVMLYDDRRGVAARSVGELVAGDDEDDEDLEDLEDIDD